MSNRNNKNNMQQHNGKKEKKEDKKIIKAEEIYDYVDTMTSNKIGEIYYLIKEDYDFNSLPILDNPKNNAYGDFIELIVDCLDINQIYRDKHNLNN